MIDMQDTNITLMNECKIPCEMLLCGRYGKFESGVDREIPLWESQYLFKLSNTQSLYKYS